MTHVVGDTSHIKSKPLSGDPVSGQTWVYDGSQYVPDTPSGAVGEATEAYKYIEVDTVVINADHASDTLHLSGKSGVKLTGTGGVGSGADNILVEVSGLAASQIPNWSEISGRADYASGKLDDVDGLSGFVMASGNGLVVTVPTPISGRVLRASGTNPLLHLYWGVDQTSTGGSGAGNAYSYILVQGTTTLDANSSEDTLNISGRSGILLTGSSGALQGDDVLFIEVGGLVPAQIPNWSEISGAAVGGSGMAQYASGKLDDTDATSGFVMSSGNGLVTIAGVPSSGQVLKWSGANIHTDAYFTADVAGGGDLQQLENSLVMVAWDVYSDDQTFSDVYIDDFENETGVDQAASTYQYDASGDYCRNIPSAVDQTADLDVSTSLHVDRLDLKGTIAYWQQTSTNKGFFSTDSAGSSPVSITAAGTEDEVVEGVLCTIGGSDYTITDVVNDGDASDEVTLTGDPADASAVSAIYGLKIDTSGSGTVEVNQVYDPDGDNNSSTTKVSPSAVSASDESDPVSNLNDDNDTTVWSTNDDPGVTPCCVKVTFSSPQVINKIGLRARNHASADFRTFPKDCSFQRPADGVSNPDVSTDAHWTDLLFALGIGDPGQNAWKYLTCTNSTAYEHYRLRITDNYGSGGEVKLNELHLIEAETITPTDLYVATTNDSSQIDCSLWTDVNSATITETTAGSSVAYYAVSFDDRTTFKVWDSSASAWRSIAKDDSGTWKYNDGASGTESWSASTVNSALGALYDAWETATSKTVNQWDKTGVDALSDANWNATGGWSTSVDTIDIAVGLKQDSEDIPKFDKVTFNHDQAATDLVLVTNSWEASEINPDDLYCVLDIEPIDSITLDTDLKAWASMDDGANYEQITGLSIFRQIGDHDYVRGDAAGLTERNDQTMRLKITGHNTKNVRVHAVALGVKYT